MTARSFMKNKKHKILVITTGGTLASVSTGEGLRPELGSFNIFQQISQFASFFELNFLELFSMDSSNMKPKHWKMLAEKIAENITSYDGIVVIHGTDTMAYTASALSYMLCGLPIPVVLTGSQLSIENPMADAVENCRSAIHMAASGVPGVFLAFDRKIFLGTQVSKVRTISFDAFDSINARCVAKINSKGLAFTDDRVFSAQEPFSLKEDLCEKIALIKFFPGMDLGIFDYYDEKRYAGIYIEAFGIGCLPMGDGLVKEKIEALMAHGTTILVGTQCLHEGANLSIYETGRLIQELGVLSAHEMTTEAAVTKLMWVLGQTSDPEKIRKYFE